MLLGSGVFCLSTCALNQRVYLQLIRCSGTTHVLQLHCSMRSRARTTMISLSLIQLRGDPVMTKCMIPLFWPTHVLDVTRIHIQTACPSAGQGEQSTLAQ